MKSVKKVASGSGPVATSRIRSRSMCFATPSVVSRDRVGIHLSSLIDGSASIFPRCRVTLIGIPSRTTKMMEYSTCQQLLNLGKFQLRLRFMPCRRHQNVWWQLWRSLSRDRAGGVHNFRADRCQGIDRPLWLFLLLRVHSRLLLSLLHRRHQPR